MIKAKVFTRILGNFVVLPDDFSAIEDLLRMIVKKKELIKVEIKII
jgi:hypothetical protein